MPQIDENNNVQKKLTNADYKEIIKDEFKRCWENPAYFFKKYCTVQNPTRGRMNFVLYKFQERVLQELMNNDYNIILKSRQMGISTLTAGYALWTMLFNSDKNILVIATKQDVAKNLITKVRYMYQNLPNWLKVDCVEDNKLNLKLNNGSQIKAVAASEDAGRSEACSMIILDEAAFINSIEEIWGSAQQTLATGGSAIILSTPCGTGNFFHKTWVEAEAGLNPFNTIRLHWSMHPDRNKEWRNKQDELLGPRMASQECFSGNTRIYTINGLIRIDELNVGDMVLTHTGKFKQVLTVMKKESDKNFEIYSFLNRNISISTSNHPFYTLDNQWKVLHDIENNQLLRSFPTNIDFNVTEFTIDLVDYIKLEYFKLLVDNNDDELIYINDRRFKTRHKRFISIDYDFGYLIGLYLAEGSKDYRRTCFSFNYSTELHDLPQKIKEIIVNKIGLTELKIRKTGTNSSNLEISSVILSQIISLFVYGNNCHEKKLTKFCYEKSNINFLNGILNGVFAGEGCLTNTANKTISLVSSDIIYDVKYISNILGYTFNSMKRTDYIGKSTKFNLTYLKTKHDAAIERNLTSILDNTQYNNSESYKNCYFKDEYFTNCKIFKQPLNEKVDVYNLEVECDNSYVTEHFIVHNCDASFVSSGNTVIPPEILQWYRETFMQLPIEKRYISYTNNTDLWFWEYCDKNKSYIVVADVARGDGNDSSGFHVLNVETLEQVAEFRGLISTKDFGNLLVNTATEYNDALLIIENANIGWATIQQVIDRQYKNLYYTQSDLKYVDVNKQVNNKLYAQDKKSVAGFTTSGKSRPLIIAKLTQYFMERSVIVKSSRLLDELDVFIYTGSGVDAKAEAARGYNDDLVLAIAIGLWVRDTSLQMMSKNIELQKSMLSAFTVSRPFADSPGIIRPNLMTPENSWEQKIGGKDTFDLRELL